MDLLNQKREQELITGGGDQHPGNGERGEVQKTVLACVALATRKTHTWLSRKERIGLEPKARGWLDGRDRHSHLLLRGRRLWENILKSRKQKLHALALLSLGWLVSALGLRLLSWWDLLGHRPCAAPLAGPAWPGAPWALVRGERRRLGQVSSGPDNRTRATGPVPLHHTGSWGGCCLPTAHPSSAGLANPCSCPFPRKRSHSTSHPSMANDSSSAAEGQDHPLPAPSSSWEMGNSCFHHCCSSARWAADAGTTPGLGPTWLKDSSGGRVPHWGTFQPLTCYGLVKRGMWVLKCFHSHARKTALGGSLQMELPLQDHLEWSGSASQT